MLSNVDLVELYVNLVQGAPAGERQLVVKFFYKNKRRNEHIDWVTGRVACVCDVRAADGFRIARDAGELGEHDQSFFIELAEKHVQRYRDQRGSVRCALDTGHGTFEAVDTDTFPCLRLARESGETGGTAPCTLNAANEVAVRAFLSGRLRFTDIAAVIDETLARLPAGTVHSFDALGQADAEARAVAAELVAARAPA